MKRFLLFPVLLLFFWGCQKAKFEYAVVCEFPPSSNPEETMTLVITDDQGDVAGHFPISLGRSSFNQKFTFDARHTSEKFGVSLISESSLFGSTNLTIASHCGVPNGASVTLNPDRFPPLGSFRLVPIKISGVSRVDSILYLSQPSWVYNPQKDVWVTDMFIRTGEVYVVRVFANGQKVERTFLFRESTIPADTLRLNFNDLDIGYKVSNFEVKPPENKTYYSVQVDMISPDYKNFVRLTQANGDPNSSSKLWVTKPDAIPNDWLVYVNFFDALLSYERLFKPGESLVVTRPRDFGIVSASSEPGQSISVRTSGEVDLVRATAGLYNPDGPSVSWTIDGDTETFKCLELPELKRFLPNADMYEQAFKHFKLSLFSIDGFDSEQVRSGFPWRSDGIYPTGRSNLRIIRKVY